MTATLIFQDSGNQYPMSPWQVDNLVREYPVIRKRTNGAQSQFTLQDGKQRFSIVANTHSEAHELLDQAYRRDRKRTA